MFLKKKINKFGVPIFYYHSIANHEMTHKWSFLSVSISLFIKQMNFLHKKGYYTCNWKELEDHVNGIKKLPKKTVMFHFDDGFLDNWSVVFPIMKKKNFKYSIVVTPEFIEKGSSLRPFVTDTKENNKDNWWGYLNEIEIKHMSASGLVDFQAHGFTHTWYESSTKIVDINTGGKFYPHIGWNKYPDKKPYWLTNEIEVDERYPIFEFKKSLELSKRFIPNVELINQLIQAYDKSKTKENNIQIYRDIINEYTQQGKDGKYESDEDASNRMMHELEDTRGYISGITGKATNYLVFPGGGNSTKVIEACKKAGYTLISKGEEQNSFNSKLYQVNRYSATYTFPKVLNEILNILFMRLQLERAKGGYFVTKLFTFLRS